MISGFLERNFDVRYHRFTKVLIPKGKNFARSLFVFKDQARFTDGPAVFFGREKAIEFLF